MDENDIDLEFRKCLEKGKLRKFPKGEALFNKEIQAASDDLAEAKDNFRSGKFKWATIQGYYSIFHTARALIYSKGYREKSHYCLIVAIRVLFVQPKILSSQLIETLQDGKRLRESADYYSNWSEEGAKRLIENTEEFLSEALKLLDTNESN
ncbi:MAG: HEPN domain-containing protein [Candidatus Ratteibacteria bacterium]|jgi:uncharacterized protein (UPF0332 family)